MRTAHVRFCERRGGQPSRLLDGRVAADSAVASSVRRTANAFDPAPTVVEASLRPRAARWFASADWLLGGRRYLRRDGRLVVRARQPVAPSCAPQAAGAPVCDAGTNEVHGQWRRESALSGAAADPARESVLRSGSSAGLGPAAQRSPSCWPAGIEESLREVLRPKRAGRASVPNAADPALEPALRPAARWLRARLPGVRPQRLVSRWRACAGVNPPPCS
jgi:hypothetical protein